MLRLRVRLSRTATVVGTARNLTKARNALTQAGNPSVELVEMDLESLRSVRKAADDLLAQAKAFDVIIANAGVMACPQGKTQDGFETQFGTNHLGHFPVSVNRIVPLLKQSARIVSLSSTGHQLSDVDLEDQTSSGLPITRLQSTAVPKPRNLSTQWRSTAGSRDGVFARRQFIPAEFRPSSAGTSRLY